MSALALRTPLAVAPDATMFDLLNAFQVRHGTALRSLSHVESVSLTATDRFCCLTYRCLCQSGKAHVAIVSARAEELSERWRALDRAALEQGAAAGRAVRMAADCDVGTVLGLITLEVSALLLLCTAAHVCCAVGFAHLQAAGCGTGRGGELDWRAN